MSNTSTIKRQLLAIAILTACSAASAGAIAQAHNTSATQAEINQPISIPAGSLATSLNSLARKTGLTLSADPALLTGKQAPALAGSYSVKQALAALLSGSGLQANQLADGSYALQKKAASNEIMTLGPVKVESSVLDGQPNGQIVASHASSASKINTAIVDIPRSVSVVTRKQLDDQQVDNISEALRYTPGMFSEVNGVNNRAASISARGYTDVGIFVDGMRLDSDLFPLVDMYGLERVEALRGPGSTLFGSGSLAGMVNVTTKRPTAEPFTELEILAGNHEHREGRFDLSDVVANNSQLRYRLTGLWRDSGSQIDNVDDDKQYLAPSLSWQPSDKFDLTLLAYYQKNSGGNLSLTMPLTGSLRPNPNGTISNKTFFGEPDTDNYDRDTTSFAWDANYLVTNQWRLQSQARYSQSDDSTTFHYARGLLADLITANPLFNIIFPGVSAALDQPLPERINTPPLGPFPAIVNGVNPLAGAVPLNAMVRDPFSYTNDRRSFTIDNHILGTVVVGSFEHQLLMGLDYLEQTLNSKSFSQPQQSAPPSSLLDALNGLSVIDVFNPVYGSAVRPFDTLTRKGDTETQQIGLYIQDQISIHEKMMLTLGARYDDYERKHKVLIFNAVTEDYHLKETALTYQAGINYSFDASITPYVSYAESFQPQSGQDYQERPFDPLEGKQYEVGVKYEMLNGNVIASLAWFDLTRENVITKDQNHVGCGGTPLGECQTTLGEVQSKGIELEVKAQPVAGLDILTSFSTNDTETTESDDAAKIGKSPTQQPDKLASLWARYTLQSGVLRGFGVSGGVRYVSATYADDANTLSVPSYTVYDLGLHYHTPHGFDLALNASNVTDKYYLASCTTSICRQGLARKVTASIKYRW